jgi:protein-tyrosine phosphatase
MARTFTLREAADLLARLGDEPSVTGDGPGERARSLVRTLADERARRSSEEADDVPDPIGKPVEEHEEAGELIVAALLPILARLTTLYAGEQAVETATTSSRATAHVPPGA